MLPVYTYADASGIQISAESNAFNFVGTWSSAGTYAATTLDTVDYGNGQFTCIVDNIGYNPQLQPARWSPLILRLPASGVITSFGSAIIIPNGTNWVQVNDLDLAYTPVITCTVQLPDASGISLYANTVGKPTNAGFTAKLNGTTPSTGYLLHFTAQP